MALGGNSRTHTRCLLRGLGVERGPSDSPPQGATDGPAPAYPLACLSGRSSERPFLPRGRHLRAAQPPRSTLRVHKATLGLGGHHAPKLFQQLRGVESCRSFLRDAQRFFSHLFPGVVGLHPSSLHRRVRKLRRYLEPLRREIIPELVGEAETLLVDSTLLEVLHPRQVSRSAGFDGAGWVRWGSFSVYGVKLHLLCAPNRVPISYELTPANVADISLTEELINEAALGEEVARKLLGDLAYRSEDLR